jgi:site-specific recombinase XerD
VHCLRHSYISHLVEDGADPTFVQHQAGHSWASTTAIYTNPQELHQTREKAQVAC